MASGLLHAECISVYLFDGDGALVNSLKSSILIFYKAKPLLSSETYSLPQTVWMSISMLTQVGRWEGERPPFLGLTLGSACMTGWGYNHLFDTFQFETALHPHRSNMNERSMHIWSNHVQSVNASLNFVLLNCSAQLYLYLTCLRIHACIYVFMYICVCTYLYRFHSCLVIWISSMDMNSVRNANLDC